MQMHTESLLYIHVLSWGSLFTKSPLSHRQHLLSRSAIGAWDFWLWSAVADSLQCLRHAADTVQKLWEMDSLGSWEGNLFCLLVLRHGVQTGHENFCKAHSFCHEKMTAVAHCAGLETQWSCPEVDRPSLVFHEKTSPKWLHWAGLITHILMLLLMAKKSEYNCEECGGDNCKGELKPRQGRQLEIRFHLE